MATDAVSLIKNDHRRMEKLFAELKAAGDGDRRALVEEIHARLSAHSRAEETEVYPVLAKAAGEEDEAEHGTHEHREAEHKLRKVRNLIGSPHFGQALDEFVAAVAHHVQEEESELLPAIEKGVGKKDLERLGAAFELIRLEELNASGYDQAAGSIPPGTDDLAESTRDELYRKAQKADIPGRSHMNKNELIEALREQD
ncbi:hemerythrin domain-containing protein [Actinoplanes sp. DH11]|uniref:hemerythrin domain-containing protein n=1 Tax=Actinoplanes sp. DH11 TaxID=2857011 RepID=UPI001E61F0C6|nr:hemerythrin domain-containing protein [Actinoplanes sp. DH11]